MLYVLKDHSDCWSEKDYKLKGRDQEVLAVDQERDGGCLAWGQTMEMEKANGIVDKSS